MAVPADLARDLTALIIEACQVRDLSPDDVRPDAPLIGPRSPLGLDSLDAVEIVVAVERAYNVRIAGEASPRDVLQTVLTLAEFVAAKMVDARPVPTVAVA